MWIHLLSLELIDGASPAGTPPIPVVEVTSTPGFRLRVHTKGETEKEKEDRRKQWGFYAEPAEIRAIEKIIGDTSHIDLINRLDAQIRQYQSEVQRSKEVVVDRQKAAIHRDMVSKARSLLMKIHDEEKAVAEEEDVMYVFSVLMSSI